MDGQDSGLFSQRVGSHSTTPNALRPPGISVRRHRRSKRRATPPDASEDKSLQLTAPGAPDPAHTPGSTSPNTTTYLDVNTKTRRRHDELRNKEQERSQSPGNHGRSTGMEQETTPQEPARQKDVLDKGSSQDKPTPQSNTRHYSEKTADVGLSEDNLNRREKSYPVECSQKVIKVRGSTDMGSVEDFQATTSPPGRRRKSATFADLGSPVGKTPSLESRSPVCLSPDDEMATRVRGAASWSAASLSVSQSPIYVGSVSSPSEQSLCRERRKKSSAHRSMGNTSPAFQGSATPPRHPKSQRSETESKGAGTSADQEWQWRSNPLLALIHRASRYRKLSVSTASGGGGSGVESVQKSAAPATGTLEGPDAVISNSPEGPATGASATPLAGGSRNAADMCRGMPSRSFARHAIFVLPPDEGTSEKHMFSSGFGKLLQRASSWYPYVCLVGLILVVVPAVILVTSFLKTRRDTSLARYEEPYADALRRVCGNEACRSAIDRLLLSADTDVKPCDDFYRYVCGRWEESRSVQLEGLSYENENRINHTLLLHRALYKLADSPVLLDHEEHNMARFYRSCHDFLDPRRAGQTKEPTVEAILLEMGINESSTHVDTFQDVFSLAFAESVVASLPSLLSGTVKTSSASGDVDFSIDVGTTLASTLPQGYVEGFLDDTFSRWHAGDERRVLLMGQVDESLEKLRAPCNASESSFMMIKDLKAPFPGGDWLGALKSASAQKAEPVYSSETNVTIRGEACIDAMLSHLHGVSVADARIYSLTVMYAQVKKYAYMVRRRSHNPLQRATQCLLVTERLFSKLFISWVNMKVIGAESTRAFAVMVDRLKKAAGTFPSLADQLNLTTPHYEPSRLEVTKTLENGAARPRTPMDLGIVTTFCTTSSRHKKTQRKATEAGTTPTIQQAVMSQREQEDFRLYYSSSGTLLLLKWVTASVQQDRHLREAIQLHQRCLQYAASSSLGRSATEEEEMLVPEAGWALKVAHWAALGQRLPVPAALAPTSPNVDQEAKQLNETRSRLFFHRFCYTSCGDDRAARACKIGVHFSKEFSAAFGCRAPPDYWCRGDNN